MAPRGNGPERGSVPRKSRVPASKPNILRKSNPPATAGELGNGRKARHGLKSTRSPEAGDAGELRLKAGSANSPVRRAA